MICKLHPSDPYRINAAMSIALYDKTPPMSIQQSHQISTNALLGDIKFMFLFGK